MKLFISDLDPMDSGNSVLLTLSNDQQVVVGNKVVDKVLRKFGLHSGSFVIACGQSAFQLDTAGGTLVDHEAGDTFHDKDGNPAGEYKYDGLHIEFDADSLTRMPVIRLAAGLPLEVVSFISGLGGNYQPLASAEVTQFIPTSSNED